MTQYFGNATFNAGGSLNGNPFGSTSASASDLWARWDAQRSGVPPNISVGTLPNSAGSSGGLDLDLEAEQLAIQKLRDPARGIYYLRFSDVQHGYATSVVPPPPNGGGGLPNFEDLTAIITLRLANGPRDLRVATIFSLIKTGPQPGVLDISLFYEATSDDISVQVRVRSPDGSFWTSKWSGMSAGAWLVLGLPLTQDNPTAVINGQIQSASGNEQGQAGSYPLWASSLLPVDSLTIKLGSEPPSSRGWADVDIHEVRLYSRALNPFETQAESEGILERIQLGSDVSFQGNAHLTTTSVLVALTSYAEAELLGTGTLGSNGPQVDPGDFQGALAWHSTLSLSDYASGSRVPTWFDTRVTNQNDARDWTGPSQVLCQPEIDGLELKYPQGAEGLISCITSGLSGSSAGWTVRLLGTPSTVLSGPFYHVDNALSVDFQKSLVGNTFDLLITTNPGSLSQRTSTFSQAVVQGTQVDLIIQAQIPALPLPPEWTLEVYINRTLTLASNTDSNTLADPVVILATEATENPNQTLEVVLTPANPYANPYERTFEILRDGDSHIGTLPESVYVETAWYSRALTATERAWLWAYADAHY